MSIPFDNIKTVFFDYDGTLHNSINIYAPAFKKAYAFLVKEGLAEDRQWSDKEISRWLGFNPEEMWKNFMPSLQRGYKQKCSNIISQEMERQIEEGKPVLYEGALETLQYLKDKEYQLVFISNCKVYYKEKHNELFRLDKFFGSLVCSGEYDFIPKHEILKKIKGNYPEAMVIVGDRGQDIEAGIKNDIYTIGCTYGFALEDELREAHMLIGDIKELCLYL